MVRPVQSLYSQGRDTGAADGSLSVTFITRANFQEPSTCRWSTRNTLPWLVDTSLSAVFSLYEKYPIQTPSLRLSVSLVFLCAHRTSFACLCFLPSFRHCRRSLLGPPPPHGRVGL